MRVQMTPCTICKKPFPSDQLLYDGSCPTCMAEWEKRQAKLDDVKWEIFGMIEESEKEDAFSHVGLILRMADSCIRFGHPTMDIINSVASEFGMDRITHPAVFKVLRKIK